MPSETPRFDEILILLADAEVELIVVGMAAAVLQGVPITTWDLDVVHRRTHDNIARLLKVLEELDAVARHDPRRLRPNESHLSGPGHVLMETRFGDFDCRGAIDGNRNYDDLLATSNLIDFQGRSVRILSLRELLAIKQRAGRAKDLAAVPYIHATIEEIENS